MLHRQLISNIQTGKTEDFNQSEKLLMCLDWLCWFGSRPFNWVQELLSGGVRPSMKRLFFFLLYGFLHNMFYCFMVLTVLMSLIYWFSRLCQIFTPCTALCKQRWLFLKRSIKLSWELQYVLRMLHLQRIWIFWVQERVPTGNTQAEVYKFGKRHTEHLTTLLEQRQKRLAY